MYNNKNHGFTAITQAKLSWPAPPVKSTVNCMPEEPACYTSHIKEMCSNSAFTKWLEKHAQHYKHYRKM